MRYLVTGEEAAKIDRYTIEEIGLPQLVLMERASLALAEQVEEAVEDKAHDRILVIAEGGNNGGDGIAAARILCRRGYRALVWLVGGLRKRTEACSKQIELAKKAGVEFVEPECCGVEGSGALKGYRILVDAIFGVGLKRPVTGVQAEAVSAINRAGREEGSLIIAVDIPTGISSESGEVLGCAVKADRTVTFGFEKAGMCFARAYCGRVTVAEIGFFLPGPEQECCGFFTYQRKDVKALLPQRSPQGNKGSFGQVLLIAGSENMSGAAYLSAEAAYRTGCGLVKVVTHESNRTTLQQLLPEAVLLTYTSEENSSGQDEDFVRALKASFAGAKVIILGPGIGQGAMAHFLTDRALLWAACPMVIDADAINILAGDDRLLGERAGKAPVILTPHMLEMARLAGKTLKPDREAVQRLREDRTRIAAAMAEQYGATVVLKDACTLVATPGQKYFLNSSGNDAMAKGGSGDVLTGVIGALIAEGLPAADAARLGVYLHGLAGDAAREDKGAYSVLARDLIDALPRVMQ